MLLAICYLFCLTHIGSRVLSDRLIDALIFVSTANVNLCKICFSLKQILMCRGAVKHPHHPRPGQQHPIQLS